MACARSGLPLLSSRLTAMPDARDQNIRGRCNDRVAHDVTGRSEADDDLPNIGIGCRHAKIGKFLQSFDRVRMAAIARRAASGLT